MPHNIKNMPNARNHSRRQAAMTNSTGVACSKRGARICLPEIPPPCRSDRELTDFTLTKLRKIELNLIYPKSHIQLEAASSLADYLSEVYKRKGINAVVSNIERRARTPKKFNEADLIIPDGQQYDRSRALIDSRLGPIKAVQKIMARGLAPRLALAERIVASGLIEKLESAKHCSDLARSIKTNPNYFPEAVRDQGNPLQNVMNIFQYAMVQAVVLNPDVSTKSRSSKSTPGLSHRTYGILLTADMILEAAMQTRISNAHRAKAIYIRENIHAHLSFN